MPKEELPAAGAVNERIPSKDRWALILSAIAIGVSLVALWDTHRTSERQVKLSERQEQSANEKIYRGLKTTVAVFDYSADPSLSSVKAIFENVGSLPITVTKATIHFEIAYALKMPNEKCVDDLNQGFFEAEQTDKKRTEL